MDRKLLLTLLILGGLVFGAIVGQLLFDPHWKASMPLSQHSAGTWLALFEFLGMTVFMGLLRMLIIPLVAVSIVAGVTSVGDFRKLGRMGSWTLLYYFSTMLIAVVVGLAVVNIIQPGQTIGENQLLGAEAELSGGMVNQEMLAEKVEGGLLGVFQNLMTMMIPSNLFEAMTSGQTLAIIVFCLFFGVIVSLVGESAEIIVRVNDALFEVLMKMVEVVLWLAPVGVFSLLAWTVARLGLGVFGQSIGLYMITVTVGLLIHGLIIIPAILYFFTRANPYLFLHQMRQALMMAVATDSSSATLPVTIDCATTEGGVSKRAAGLVLPLGATINMDGTALYEAVAVVFMAQAFGIDLGFSQMLIIAITATLAAVGAAGIPSAGLVTMVIVLDATNKSLLAMSPTAATIPIAAIGLIIGVDRLLDMLRTMVNVWGDAVGSKLISLLDDN